MQEGVPCWLQEGYWTEWLFFKGLTNGELLCALGRDANNQMYLIAWAIVERETKESWDFFLSLLSTDLQFGDGDGWVFISDQ